MCGITETTKACISGDDAAEVARLDRIAQYTNAALSDATRKAYWADFGQFTKWAVSENENNLPASTETLCKWIDLMAQQGKKISTIRRSLSTIRAAHKLEGYDDPLTKPVKMVLSGLARTIGCQTRQAEPITLSKLRKMISVIPNDLRGVRNRALILLGWFAALRRSEIVAIKIDDIEVVDEGFVLTLRRSKTDQVGEGRRLPIPWVTDSELCAVSAVKQWITVAQINEGFLFRSIGNTNRETPEQLSLVDKTRKNALSGRSVSLIIQAIAKKAGLKWRAYSGHSLRSGFATTCAAAGISDRDIQAITGHKTARQLATYIREGNLWNNCPVHQLLGRKENNAVHEN